MFRSLISSRPHFILAKNKLNFVFWIFSQTSVFFVHCLVFGGAFLGLSLNLDRGDWAECVFWMSGKVVFWHTPKPKQKQTKKNGRKISGQSHFGVYWGSILNKIGECIMKSPIQWARGNFALKRCVAAKALRRRSAPGAVCCIVVMVCDGV